MYVSLRGDDAIAIFKMNDSSGELKLIKKEDVEGGPAALAFSPDKKYLYVALRSANAFASYKIDKKTGLLEFMNSISALDNPVYISTDKTGKYLLSAYYDAAKIGTYKIESNGKLKAGVIQKDSTQKNPHFIQTDKTNRYLFVADKSADKIYQFLFDVKTGGFTNNDPKILNTPAGTGPRHFVINNKNSIVYFSDELNGTVTAYRLNKKGTLKPFQIISTLPPDYKGPNTSAEIRLTPDNKFLYASNRGPDDIAAFSVDVKTGTLKATGYFPTGKTPRAFNISPDGNFLIAAGEDSDNIVIYRIDKISGNLTKLQTLHAGARPSWVAIEGY